MYAHYVFGQDGLQLQSEIKCNKVYKGPRVYYLMKINKLNIIISTNNTQLGH